MNSMLRWLDKYILPGISKIAENKHLRAIRDGIVSVLPLIIIGSVFLLFGQLPVDALKEDFLLKHKYLKAFVEWYKLNKTSIIMPYRLTMQFMALFAAFGISYNLAKNYKLNGIQSGMISAGAFLITQVPVKMEAGWFLPMKYMGGQGIFASIICSFFAVEVTRFCENRKMNIKMPDGVPPSVVTAFSSLLPAFIVFTTVWLFTDVFGLDIIGFILKIFSPLMYLGDTIIAIIVINLVMQVIWLGGVHGASIVNAVFLTVWMNYLEANAAAQSTNSVMPHITSLPFYQWYIWIGGSGATLALVILMLFSKNEFIKDLGRISILPGICNINEPIIYGLPIVMNPIMALPFIFTPIITGVISYVIVDLGLITRFFTMVPWTLPAPIGGFLASGGDYRAVILIFLNILIAGIIYFPFLKSYERSLEKKEQVNE